MSLLTGHGEWEDCDYDNLEDHGCCNHLKDRDGIIEEVKPSEIGSLTVKFGMRFETYTKTRIKETVRQNEKMLWALKEIEKMIEKTDSSGMIPIGSIKKLARTIAERVEKNEI